MGSNSDIRTLMERIITALVDDPDKVEIRAIGSEQAMTFLVIVAQNDVGKVVGQSGRTARSLRILLSAIGMKSKTRYALDIVSRKI
jgi:uncharacterized protein